MGISSQNLKISAILLASTSLWSSSAWAQTPEAAASAPVNEIIVTATKRSETLQNVPISLQVLSPAVMEQHQVTSFDDYVKLLPSVSYQSFGPSQAQLYFRGIASGGDGLAAGPLPGSGLYVDETPVTTIYQSLDIHVYDMARVEALAGPQGTLYGASSLSGTLRLITNKPDPTKFKGGVDAEINKFGKGGVGGSVEGFVNLPLNERMALRVMGFYQHDGGYIDNTPGLRTYQRPHYQVQGDPNTPVLISPLTVNNSRYVEKNFNDVESYGGRAALGIELDDSWTATPTIFYQHQKANGAFLYDPKVGDLEVHDFTPDRNLDKWWLASLTIQGKLSDWDVTYSGSYLHRSVDNVADYSYFSVAYDSYTDYNYAYDSLGRDIDPTQVIHGHDTYTKQAHEIRVSSPSENRLRLTTGMYFQRQTDKRLAEYIIPNISSAVAPFSPPVPGAGPDDVYFTHIYRVDRDYAVFGEASFDIVPGLTLTGGIRGFMAKNTLYGFSGSAGAISASCAAQNALACPNINKKYDAGGETHKANLTWKVDKDRMVYFTYSTGFRPGGNNRNIVALGQTVNVPPYKADTLTNYEIGWKTSWFNRALRFNGAIFLEDWDKIQYSLPGVLGIFSTFNAGKARSKGVEGDISWTMGGLNLMASGTYVDAKLRTDFCDQVKGCDPLVNGGSVLAPKGTRLPITPKFKINGTARYSFDFGSTKSFIQAGVSHQSGTTSYLTSAGAAALGPTKGFTTFDFSAGAHIGNWRWEAFIQNAFDKRGILSKNTVCAPSLCAPYARLYPTKPQFFGLKAGYDF